MEGRTVLAWDVSDGDDSRSSDTGRCKGTSGGTNSSDGIDGSLTSGGDSGEDASGDSGGDAGGGHSGLEGREVDPEEVGERERVQGGRGGGEGG